MKNEPAFPDPQQKEGPSGQGGTVTIVSNYPHKGMTLRDYFAAKAMQGICSDQQGKAAIYHEEAGGDIKKMPIAMAEVSYAYADAMLKAREK